MNKLRVYAILGGIIGVTVGPWIAYDNFASSSWSTAEGVVQSSSVTPTRRNWRVELKYTFNVQGRSVGGYMYRPGGSLVGSEDEAQRLVALYSPGSRVTVYYDPADTRYSALKVGLEPSDAIGPMIGLLALIYGLWPRRARV